MSTATPCLDATHTPHYHWRKVDHPHWTCPDCENDQKVIKYPGLGDSAIWQPDAGVLVEHQPDGFHMPAGHVEAVEATHYACRWLWDRRDVWPCFHDRKCDEPAVWGVERPGWKPVKYYCDKHTPVRAGQS